MFRVDEERKSVTLGKEENPWLGSRGGDDNLAWRALIEKRANTILQVGRFPIGENDEGMLSFSSHRPNRTRYR